jgi:2-octaprenyl-6-methoxyphenol hydroxylase
MSDRDEFDVLIVGGGPVGLTLGLALAQSARGIRIGLVDRRPLSVPRDARASAIAAGVRRVFEALGVWEEMAAEAQPILAMRITDSGEGDIARPLFLTFEGEVAPGEAFAHMVPNRVSGKILLEAAEGRIEVIAPATITGLATQGDAARLILADDRVLRAPLVVAADGGQSALRGMADMSISARPAPLPACRCPATAPRWSGPSVAPMHRVTSAWIMRAWRARSRR